MTIDIESPGGSEADLRAAISNLKNSYDNIITGASPTAADPETDVTFVTTGGTDAAETVTLALPASPELKVGRTKRFIIAAITSSQDRFRLDDENVIGSNDDTIEDSGYLGFEMNGIGSCLDLRLVHSVAAPGYKWQIVGIHAFGYEPNIIARYLYPWPTIGGGSRLLVFGGDTYESGNAGHLDLKGGDAFGDNGNGGNVIIRGGAAGSGGVAGAVVLQDLQAFADDAAAATGGIPVGGLYRTASALKIRVS